MLIALDICTEISLYLQQSEATWNFSKFIRIKIVNRQMEIWKASTQHNFW